MEYEGIRWGRWSEVTELRRGGMADIFLVKRSFYGFERSFVVKRIQERYCLDDLARELFHREARIHSSFSHPHIVQLVDFGVDRSFLYMVLEYVSGGDLFDRMKRISLEDQESRLRIILQAFDEISSALSTVHSRAVHHDVSPCNILCTEDDSFKLGDFGLASENCTAEPELLDKARGKILYLSPEMAIKGAKPDPRSDLFSLAATMAEAFSGKKLYAGQEGPQILKMLRSGDYLSYFHSLSLPDGLAQIILRSVQPCPSNRYQSAGELNHAIRVCRAQNLLSLAPSPRHRAHSTRSNVPQRPRSWARLVSAVLLLPASLIWLFLKRSWRSQDLVRPS